MTTVLTLKEHDERVGTVNPDNSLNFPRWDILGRPYNRASVANEVRWFTVNGLRRFVVIPPDAEQPVVVDIFAADLIGMEEKFKAYETVQPSELAYTPEALVSTPDETSEVLSGIALEPLLEGQGATQGEGVDVYTSTHELNAPSTLEQEGTELLVPPDESSEETEPALDEDEPEGDLLTQEIAKFAAHQAEQNAQHNKPKGKK